MSDIPVGINNVETTSDDFVLVSAGQNNPDDGPDEINESGADRMWRMAYYEEGNEPDTGSNLDEYIPKFTEVRMWPLDGTTATFEDPAPLTETHDAVPGSISVSASLGYGPISAGVSFSPPVNHPIVHDRLTAKDGDYWKIQADETMWDLKGPEWPTGPAEPSGLVEEVPMTQVDVAPDQWRDADEYRAVHAEATHHYTYSYKGATLEKTSNQASHNTYYRVINDDD